MKTSKPTYVLFVPGASSPTVRHDTIEEARTEAKRLIDIVRVNSVMVCQFIEGLERVSSVRAMKKNPLPDDDAMPF